MLTGKRQYPYFLGKSAFLTYKLLLCLNLLNNKAPIIKKNKLLLWEGKIMG
jgi:hypothetical protein